MSEKFVIDFFQEINPLYVLPIFGVVLCIFLVYAVGFKSPVPPPSFDGLEEEKKHIKKKKSKDPNKTKSQNVKLNGSSGVSKSVQPLQKKKDPTEKSVAPHKASHVEKSDKKVTESKHHGKKIQDKKGDSFQDDFNEDGWVQLVSKKCKKNRKKEDSGSESLASKSKKLVDVDKTDDCSPVQESPKEVCTLQNENLKEKKMKPKAQSKDASGLKHAKGESEVVISDEMSMGKNVEVFESIKEPLKKHLEIIPQEKAQSEKNSKVPTQPVPLPDVISTPAAVEGMKSNKKKKNAKTVIKIESTDNVAKPDLQSLLETTTNQLISDKAKKKKPDIVPEGEIINTDSSVLKPVDLPKISPEISETKKGEVPKENEKKSSNVVFDELAGLYPEPKDLKKKKKVRRDH